jgi:hypothetical protein
MRSSIFCALAARGGSGEFFVSCSHRFKGHNPIRIGSLPQACCVRADVRSYVAKEVDVSGAKKINRPLIKIITELIPEALVADS